MRAAMKISGSLVLAGAASACSTTGALRSEIAAIETRLHTVEGEITAGTNGIAEPGKDIRTRISYRPFQAWAAGFGTKEFSYRQTAGGGDIERQSKRCRPLGGSRPGYRVFIHEDRSTKMDLKAGPLAFEPTEKGFNFTAGFDLYAKTQLAAAGRAPCFGGWSPTVSIGAEVQSRPKTVLEFALMQGSEMKPRYSVVLTAPDRLNLEFRTGIDIPHVGDIDIRHTFRPKIGDLTLFAGELDLLVENQSQLAMPSGEMRNYLLSTVAPTVATDRTAITFETDVEVRRLPDPTTAN